MASIRSLAIYISQRYRYCLSRITSFRAGSRHRLANTGNIHCQVFNDDKQTGLVCFNVDLHGFSLSRATQDSSEVQAPRHQHARTARFTASFMT